MAKKLGSSFVNGDNGPGPNHYDPRESQKRIEGGNMGVKLGSSLVAKTGCDLGPGSYNFMSDFDKITHKSQSQKGTKTARVGSFGTSQRSTMG